MSKCIKLAVFTFFMAFSFGLVLCGESSADTSITPKEYVQYLTEKGRIDPEALEVRDQFQKLSNSDKIKYIYYVTNAQIAKELSQVHVPENSKKILYGGDIVITRQNKTTTLGVVDDVDEQEKCLFDKMSSILVTPAYAAGQIHHMRADDTQVEYVCGVKSRTFKAWVIYNSKDKKTVTSIQDGNGNAISHIPTNKFVKDSVTKYIYGNKAHCCLVWHFCSNLTTPFLDSSIFRIEYNHHVLGFANGGKTYRLYRG